MTDSLLATLSEGSLRLLADLLLIGTPIALGVAAAFRISRGGHPRLRYLIAVLGFALAALVPIGRTLAPPRAPAPASVDRTGVDPMSDPGPVGESHTPGLSASSAALTAALPAAPAVLLLWLLVAAVLAARELTGHHQLARSRRWWRPGNETLLRELRWPANVPLYVDERDGPSAVGFLRSAVVVPLGLSGRLGAGMTQRIAWHELSHARWRDPAVNAALRLLRALLWPSLPLWALERSARIEREAAADWAAVTQGGRTPSPEVLEEYASALVAVARWFESAGGRASSALAGTQAGTGSALGERVARLLQPRGPNRVRVALAGCVLLAGTWGAAAVPAAPPQTSLTAIADTVLVDNPAGAPVVITAARLPHLSGERAGDRYHPLPVFAIRNASQDTARRIVIGIWNGGALDARLLYRETLPPGTLAAIDPADGSPNVFYSAVSHPLLRVLSVEFVNGRRWSHPAWPDAASSAP